MVRQELASEKGIRVHLRTVERAVEPWRQELRNAALATVRFETPPGRQLQADFGQCVVRIGGERVRVHLAVLTLGYSRRLLVRAFRSEKQDHWLQALEEAFRHWGGVPKEVLVDNARALVSQHDPEREILVFAERLETFARYWDFKPGACRPYRARTKGKDERGVAYVKRNAIAGREFASWAELEAHLVRWTREVADVRIHGTTGEAPLQRFERGGSPGAAAAGGQAVVPGGAGAGADRAQRLLRGGGGELVFGAPVADPSAGERAGERPAGADPPRRTDRGAP